MTFDKQLEKAKEEKLKYRLIRDIIFIFLGIIFLLISIISAYNNKEVNNKDKETTVINETKKD